MTADEIVRLEARLDRVERLLYLAIGIALGTGALQITQLVGI